MSRSVTENASFVVSVVQFRAEGVAAANAQENLRGEEHPQNGAGKIEPECMPMAHV